MYTILKVSIIKQKSRKTTPEFHPGQLSSYFPYNLWISCVCVLIVRRIMSETVVHNSFICIALILNGINYIVNVC